MATPQTMTGLTLLQQGNLTYATLVVTDPHGNLAAGTTEFVQNPSGLLVPKRADALGTILNTSRITSTLTTTALAANGVYTQGWQDAQALAVTYVGGSVTADQAGTLVINFSDDGVNVAATLPLLDFLPGTAGTANAQALAYPMALPSRYWQWVYTNGATAQGTFALYQTPMNEWPGNTMPPSLSVAGGTMTVGTTAVPLPDLPCVECTVQADPSNTGTVALGNANGQWIILSPGADISIAVANANILYALGSASGQVLHVLARG